MKAMSGTAAGEPLRPVAAAPLALAAVVCFHLAYSFAWAGFLMAGFLAGLFALSRLGGARLAFYFGVSIGLLAYGPQLGFFWSIFGPAAAALWLVLAFWLGLFLLLLWAARQRLGPFWAAILAPFLWTGIEYFRSELYPLRFSWLNTGFAFSGSPQLFPLTGMGVYGIGFALMTAISLSALLFARRSWLGVAAVLAGLGIVTNLPSPPSPPAAPSASVLRVTGVQMELPAELETPLALQKALAQHPDTDLLALSEYTYDGPVPARVRQWCARHSRYLVVGGKEPVGEDRFRNTAYVVDPRGNVAFQQAKAMPIQFFKDGLAAEEQRLWESPWGKIGLAICYDLSYTRVMDRLATLGAQALIVPTMDLAEWGRHEHELHARVAPVRAAEYGLPLLRVASSGISQLLDARGRLEASAPFPGEQAVLHGHMRLAGPGRIPSDRLLAWQSTCLAALLLVCLAAARYTDLPWRPLALPAVRRRGTGRVPPA